MNFWSSIGRPSSPLWENHYFLWKGLHAFYVRILLSFVKITYRLLGQDLPGLYAMHFWRPIWRPFRLEDLVVFYGKFLLYCIKKKKLLCLLWKKFLEFYVKASDLLSEDPLVSYDKSFHSSVKRPYVLLWKALKVSLWSCVEDPQSMYEHAFLSPGFLWEDILVS